MSNLTRERPITLHIVCSWCRCDMGTKETVAFYTGEPDEHAGETHSICDDCFAEHYGERGAA